MHKNTFVLKMHSFENEIKRLTFILIKFSKNISVFLFIFVLSEKGEILVAFKISSDFSLNYKSYFNIIS